MFESEADRLAEIQSLDGRLVRTETAGEFWAIYDNDFAEVFTDGAPVESTGPALNCRTSDVARLAIEPKTIVRILLDSEEIEFQVRRLEQDGTGMSIVRLRRI